MEDEIKTPEEESALVVDIQFRPGQKVYYFDPAGLELCPGDHVIIDTARGPEFGACTSSCHRIPAKDVVAPLRPVLRRATAHDEKVVAENHAREKRAYDICLTKIAEHRLDMQLVSAECAFDGSKILFFFTADERVDFRELVKNLAGIFHTRIELRQIGVRDKAKMVGGLGICGRPFCCASFLEDFQPVSIKMAKTQSLSLNPTKISGTCGRLMCCLKYEQEAYEDLIRNSPKAESFVDTPEGRGTVVEVDLLRQRVKVRLEDQPDTLAYFANADIAVLRSGKARKSDPPIPADLAPISGSGKRVRREEPEEPVVLENIRFRYSTESLVEDPAPAAPVEEVPAEKPVRNHRRPRKPRQPAGEGAPQKPQQSSGEGAPRKSQQTKPAAAPRDAAPDAPKEPRPNKPRRRPNYRPRKPRRPGGSENAGQ